MIDRPYIGYSTWKTQLFHNYLKYPSFVLRKKRCEQSCIDFKIHDEEGLEQKLLLLFK